ncbi:MAG TPA: hypothetical protein VGO92_01495 [Acidimicrobiales bacterium]|nr:hypothetical protein [Acidimicrobiales bacterium]
MRVTGEGPNHEALADTPTTIVPLAGDPAGSAAPVAAAGAKSRSSKGLKAGAPRLPDLAAPATRAPILLDPGGDAETSTGCVNGSCASRRRQPSLDLLNGDMRATSSVLTMKVHVTDLSAPLGQTDTATGPATHTQYFTELLFSDGAFELSVYRDVNNGSVIANGCFCRREANTGALLASGAVAGMAPSVDLSGNAVVLSVPMHALNDAVAAASLSSARLGLGVSIRPTFESEVYRAEQSDPFVGSSYVVDTMASPDPAFAYRLGD